MQKKYRALVQGSKMYIQGVRYEVLRQWYCSDSIEIWDKLKFSAEDTPRLNNEKYNFSWEKYKMIVYSYVKGHNHAKQFLAALINMSSESNIILCSLFKPLGQSAEDASPLKQGATECHLLSGWCWATVIFRLRSNRLPTKENNGQSCQNFTQG